MNDATDPFKEFEKAVSILLPDDLKAMRSRLPLLVMRGDAAERILRISVVRRFREIIDDAIAQHLKPDER